jgi:hypothetical protein
LRIDFIVSIGKVFPNIFPCIFAETLSYLAIKALLIDGKRQKVQRSIDLRRVSEELF